MTDTSALIQLVYVIMVMAPPCLPWMVKLWKALANSMFKLFFPENSSCFGDAHDLLHSTRKKAYSEMSLWCC